jgi:hypothetical protein
VKFSHAAEDAARTGDAERAKAVKAEMEKMYMRRYDFGRINDRRY